MGIYFNPNNMSFSSDKNSKIYVDKTILIEYLNGNLCKNTKCLAVSHARRFGKSHAAGMIDAYYSLGCDSTKLFENTKLSQTPDYKKYMNKYNVIHLDISSFWDDFKYDLIENVKKYIIDDFKKSFNDEIDYSKKFSVILMSVYQKTKNKCTCTQ